MKKEEIYENHSEEKTDKVDWDGVVLISMLSSLLVFLLVILLTLPLID